MFESTGESVPPYAKQVTMQRDVRKTLMFSHFQLNFLCIVFDDGFEIVLKYLSGDNAHAPTKALQTALERQYQSESWLSNCRLANNYAKEIGHQCRCFKLFSQLLGIAFSFA
jgi:hypothetical protein